MTTQEALTEARRRWGNGATVTTQRFQGRIAGREVLEPYGEGSYTCKGKTSTESWEDAFADADRQAENLRMSKFFENFDRQRDGESA